MAKPKRYRWVCPSCGKGALGSSRPAKNATVRFCLPCSGKSTTLVERTCPTLDKARAEKAEREKAARERSRASEQRRKAKAREKRDADREARYLYGGFDLRKEATKMCAAARNNGYSVVKPKMNVRWRHRGSYTTGFSYHHRRYIALTIPKGSPAAPALVLLAHELAHQATPRDVGHGDEWRWCFKAILADLYGVGSLELDGRSSHALHRALTKALGEKLSEALTEAQLETREEEGED